MLNNMKRYLLLIILGLWGTVGLSRQGDNFPVTGIVLDQLTEAPIPGANIVLKGTTHGTVTDADGHFLLHLKSGPATLIASFIGYEALTLEVFIPTNSPLEIYLKENPYALAEVQVISTGFQELTAERTTGSFVKLDEKLIHRRVSTSIVDRLEDVTPGLIFNRDRADLGTGESISIRGNSSLLADRNPLIVVDNLAYDGPIENLNPNDVESITVLRDAAAASIWGARAGNGVIVIKTKSGQFDQPIRVQWNSNITLQEAFDPFYMPRMNVSTFVDKEIDLFKNGIFANREEQYGNPKLSALVEDLIANREGQITDDQLNGLIENYRNTDVRTDLAKYFYRPSLRQQYSLQLTGGSKNYSFSMGLGMDKNRETQVGTDLNRFTLSLQQNWKVWHDRLEFGLGTYLIQSNVSNSFPELEGMDPYVRLVNENGDALPVLWRNSVRFKSSLSETGILDWDYYPKEELGLNPLINRQTEVRINPRLDFKLGKGFSLNSNYQLWSMTGQNERVYAMDSFFARNMINRFTEIHSPGNITHRVPLGAVYDFSDNRSFSHNWRNQLNFNSIFGDHEISALVGNEIKDFQSESRSGRAYGYNEDTGISQVVDPLTFYQDLTTGFTEQIPFPQSFTGRINRFVSNFTNIGYTYKGKYLLTASARMDGSNLYGVSTNNRVVPLWSAGLGWIVSEESWMDIGAMDFLKLKMSYGFNGNTNPAATAFTTGMYFGASSNRWVGQPWLSILNPPNPSLRWEKIKILNLGADFEWLKGILRGGIEVYSKDGIDLFGNQPIYPSSGVTTVARNYASTRSRGLDLNLSARLIRSPIRWDAHFFYSYIQEKVFSFDVDPVPTNAAIYSSGMMGIGPSPVKGYPIYSIFSFPTSGLDANTGDPRGILDGEPSSDYSRILAETRIEELTFHGSAIPTHFGALRNHFGWKGFDLSMNVSYRLGYYFRRESIIYDFLNRGEIGHSDYNERWQSPGDEQITTIPSDPGISNPQRNTFDQVSSRSVRRGDHIRLQDIQVSYTFRTGKVERSPEIQFYGYANNLGIIWKSARDVHDPDFRNIQAPKAYSMGVKINY